jgi:hypothetical protein
MNSYNQMLENIDKLQNLGFSSEFDIQPYLLSEDDVAKKIILLKAPNMSKEDIDLIIDSEKISIDKVIKEIEAESEAENSRDLSLSEEEKAIRRERREIEVEKRKELKRKQIQEMKQIYKDRIVEYREQAKNILKEIKIAFYNLVREVKALVIKSTTSIVQTSSSIPAIAVIIAAPPWNIPLAISYIMTIVDLLLNLISQLKSIIPFTTSFDKLKFVTNTKNLSIISKIINTNLEIILGLWSKLTGLDKIIKLLLDKIIQLTSGGNKEKIFKKATKKLKKLGYFKDNESYNIDGVSVKANSEEDASEIKDIIDVFKVSSNRIVGYKEETPEDLLNSIRNEVNKVQKIEVPTNIEDSLYDVRLPDGTVLINQTDDDLEELKKVYNIVLGQIDELSRNIE